MIRKMSKKFILSFIIVFLFVMAFQIADTASLEQIKNPNNSVNYRYIKPIAIKSINPIINKFLQTGWDGNFEKVLGKPDSYFNKYSIYFNKGIKIDSRQKVFNIVFNGKFKGSIVNSITVKSSKDEITKSLGNPQFISSDNKIIGYKSENFYIFFITKKDSREISIYRRDTAYDKKILKEVIKDLSEKNSYQKYEYLKSKWPLYDIEYNERGGFCALYYSIGVFLNNNGDFNREYPDLRVFGNYEGFLTDEISLPGKIDKLKGFNRDLIMLELDKDAIFEYEKTRIDNDNQIEKKRISEGVLSKDGSMRAMQNDGGTYEHAGIYILSVNRTKTDLEFRTPHFPSDIKWLNNRYLIYSVYMYGIYLFDTKKAEIIDVKTSKAEDSIAEYEIISAEAGQIIYNDYTSEKVVKFKYYFDKYGNIKLNNK